MIHPSLPMLALSVRQPWAHCIIHLGKPVENRKWSNKVRGEVCIHASLFNKIEEWMKALSTYQATRPGCEALKAFPPSNTLLRGGIIGTVEIVDVVTQSDSPWFSGPKGFVLANPKPCDFIPVKGQLGFFDWRKNLSEATDA
ncbi:ASCH domain-containing protein [Rhizobium sp. 18065]|uniref:ASCH domain-containing protein n=1 Tax=Rhizobium sp. 18065 TaxID=2681411 RepID=UPI00135C4465|nr:ASCH domain-containing protein [Rhizobium sp. 18065]